MNTTAVNNTATPNIGQDRNNNGDAATTGFTNEGRETILSLLQQLAQLLQQLSEHVGKGNGGNGGGGEGGGNGVGNDDDPIDGTRGDDTLNGTNENDTLNGFGGDDTIRGRRGDDSINGGAGNDVLRGGRGDDEIDGGSGNDDIRGGRGNDTIDAGNGNDEVRGGRGNDVIDGGRGNDEIRGGRGNDEINGGSGSDRLTGGAGRDEFVFDADNFGNGVDTITDFRSGRDSISISGGDDVELVYDQESGELSARDGDETVLVARLGEGTELGPDDIDGATLVDGNGGGDGNADVAEVEASEFDEDNSREVEIRDLSEDVPRLSAENDEAAMDFRGTHVISNQEQAEAFAELVGIDADDLPDVDFDSELLLIEGVDANGPSTSFVSADIDDDGTLRPLGIVPLVGFTPSDQTDFNFATVDREGVTGVVSANPINEPPLADE